MPVIEDFKVVQHLEFEVAEYQRRATNLADSCDGAFDAVVLFAPDMLRYFTGYRSLLERSRWRPLSLCLPVGGDGDPFLCLPEQEHGVARATSWIDDLRITTESVRNGHEDPIDALCSELQKRGFGKGRIGVELGFGQRLGLSAHEFERFRSQLADAQFGDVAPALWASRSLKSQVEIDCLRRACEISCKGVRAGFEIMRAGMTEREVHRVMVETMIHEGAEEVWLTFGSGAKGYAAFNSYPSDLVLKAGDLVWVDGGARSTGYVCDFIRTAVVGEPSPDQQRWYSASLEANRAAVDLLGPGMECGTIFAAARSYIKAAGLIDAWGLDVLGHGVGVEIHELPSITEGSTERLRPGHVVTIEPSLSPPRHEHGHYIIEEVIAITTEGHENLTETLPADLWITEG